MRCFQEPEIGHQEDHYQRHRSQYQSRHSQDSNQVRHHHRLQLGHRKERRSFKRHSGIYQLYQNTQANKEDVKGSWYPHGEDQVYG